MEQPPGLDALLAKQKEMVELAATTQHETDPARIQTIVERLQELGGELKAMAQSFETRSPDAFTEVVLTAAQRQRVLDETGEQVDSVVLRDEGGATTRTMPGMDPRIIEFYALQEGRRRKAAAEAEVQLRAQLDEAIAAIERQGTAAVRDQLDALKRDPAFLGGILHKK